MQNYEKELYQLIQAIQEFQTRSNNLKPNNNSKLGRASAFTGYNGMKLGDDVKAAPGMLLKNQPNNSSIISAYGSQGMMKRDTSQILNNLTPLQGMTSALTNSNFKMNNAFVNSNCSSAEQINLREE